MPHRDGGVRHRNSPDHLVGLEEEGRRDGEAERLRGLEVDDQLELGGLLYREVRGFGTFEEST